MGKRVEGRLSSIHALEEPSVVEEASFGSGVHLLEHILKELVVISEVRFHVSVIGAIDNLIADADKVSSPGILHNGSSLVSNARIVDDDIHDLAYV